MCAIRDTCFHTNTCVRKIEGLDRCVWGGEREREKEREKRKKERKREREIVDEREGEKVRERQR